MMLALDRPIFAALRTRQANFAEGGPRALRYRSDVAPFAAAACEDEESLEELASLIGADQSVMLAQAVESPAPPGTIVEALADGLQMVASTVEILDADVRIEDLTDADAPEMRELASLTNPGPFLPRTHLLGKFVGIRHLNRLVAMAGERMKLPGFTEVSGVCTHPEFRGRGFAGLLTRVVAAGILTRGETPFLHVYARNAGAIRLYESLGFKGRRTMKVVVLRRAS